jgi:hypothetical protein
VAAFATACSPDECNVFPAIPNATFELTCDSPDITSVAVSGPCEIDAGASSYVSPRSIAIANSPTPGVCHVELTFATGFTYATDVTFEPQPFTQCGGGQVDYYVEPTQSTFAVNTPPAPCGDAGVAAGPDGATGLDAAPDSGLESGIDVALDSGDVAFDSGDEG